MSPAFCAGLREQFEQLFEIRLNPTQVSVHAHKLTPGQFIKSHNDRPTRGLPTHRVIVNLNHGYDDSYGGELVLFDRKDIASTAVVVPPVHNTGIAMEFSAQSWHSVEEVRGGTRFSVIYSFWLDTAELPAATADILPADELVWLVEQLVALGADRVSHTKRSLLEHLTGTFELLAEWGCDADVCRAGLFHSVMGTRGFPEEILDPARQDELNRMIGDYATTLVALFSRHTWGDILEFREGSIVDGTRVSPELKRSLVTLAWANKLEQQMHMDGPVTAKDAEAAARLFEKSERWLGTEARRAVAAAVGVA